MTEDLQNRLQQLQRDVGELASKKATLTTEMATLRTAVESLAAEKQQLEAWLPEHKEEAKKQEAEHRRRAMEAGIRAVLALFAAVLGFGLKRMLDGQPGAAGYEELAAYRWATFTVVVALFARYLSGSGFHFAFEHARQARADARSFVADVMFLAAFGLLGLSICYAPNVHTLLMRIALLNLLALIWSVARANETWRFYLPINLLSLVSFAIFYAIAKYSRDLAFEPWSVIDGLNWFWLDVVVVSMLILVLDLRGQLSAVSGDDALKAWWRPARAAAPGAKPAGQAS
jgi:cation transport ATPase